MIALIAAIGPDRVIGRGGRLPWRLPADLARFKALTMGKPVIMGQATWESLRRSLPGRNNIVLSDDARYAAPGCVVAHSLEEALVLAGDAAEVFFIGGGCVYRQALPIADRMYLTYVTGEFSGDTRFPEFDPAEWREVAREARDADQDNPHPCVFVVLERVVRPPAGE
ncbi:MAG: type 3 dihydrofolate reductase [Planctomycetes bacterium]|nr:type 3 dihydrofolate reductase [Planctomycetota bacterium]